MTLSTPTPLSIAIPFAGLLLAAAPAGAAITMDPAMNVVAGSQPSGMAAGDFDNDGDVDLATTVDGPDRVALLLNDGTGSYAPGPSIILPNSSSPQDVESGDIDGDGDMDLAVALRDPQGAVAIYINNAGVFSLAATVTVGERPRGLSIADFDGDGDGDIATADRDGGTSTVIRNNGGTFSTQTLAVGGEPRDTAFGDFDGDGDLDLAVTEHDGRAVAVFSNSAGTFAPSTTLFVNPLTRPEGIVAADLDNDGLVDLAVGVSDQTLNINQVNVFMATVSSFSGPFGYNTGGSNTGQIMAADLDCDGLIDVATSNNDSANVSFLQNTGGGAFGPALLMGAGTSPGEITGGDIDGDGDIDVATANRDSNNVSVFRNTSCTPQEPCPADVDGDGMVSVTDLTELILAWGPNPGHPADINGDGVIDVQDLTTLILAWGMCP